MLVHAVPTMSLLDDLLHRVCNSLQLSATDYNLAVGHYEAIGNYLHAKGSPVIQYDPDIYPQGSLRIGTTVKPRGRQEYDLDIVCELREIVWQNFSDPVSLLAAIYSWLKTSDLYKDKVELLNRCVRVNYEHKFHLDILPACPDGATGHCCVVVPDRKADGWKPSNPRGYAKWFEAKAENYEFERMVKAMEALPERESIETKPPLKRVVQLVKRKRDIDLGYDSKAAISIVLTTLCATHYYGQASVADALTGILESIVASLPKDGSCLRVANPMNEQEILSERWDNDPKLYDEFVGWITELRNKWREANQAAGISRRTVMLSDLFGEDRVKRAVEDQARFFNDQRSSERLGMNKTTGIITSVNSAASMPIKSNNFFGE